MILLMLIMLKNEAYVLSKMLESINNLLYWLNKTGKL